MELLNKVCMENIYRIITDLEGPKYPLDNLNELNLAADYIEKELKSYGVKTEVQEFYIEGMDVPFKNVIGRIGDPSQKATVLGSHYDTVRNAPGANDNLSAVAVSLEVIRILNELKNPPSVIFASFTLEEGNPSIRKELDKLNKELNLIDDKYRFTSAKLLHFSKEISNKYTTKRKKGGKNAAHIYTEIYEEVKENLSTDEDNYLKSIVDVYNKYLPLSPIGEPNYAIGSYEFASSFKNIQESIKDVIVFDCLGWVYPNSKKTIELPFEDQVKPLIQTHNVDINKPTSNFISFFGEKNSHTLLGKFAAGCQNEEVDMPYMAMGIPFDYDAIKKNIPDVLRSDHGVFWKMGIPGIFISDMANFRSSFYHTPADISKNINYYALAKIAKATIFTLLQS